MVALDVKLGISLHEIKSKQDYYGIAQNERTNFLNKNCYYLYVFNFLLL